MSRSLMKTPMADTDFPDSREIFRLPLRMETSVTSSSGMRCPLGVSTRIFLIELMSRRSSSFKRTTAPNFFSPSQISVASLPPRVTSMMSSISATLSP